MKLKQCKADKLSVKTGDSGKQLSCSKGNKIHLSVPIKVTNTLYNKSLHKQITDSLESTSMFYERIWAG